jgi:import inner membrane translocase subunit TIM50
MSIARLLTRAAFSPLASAAVPRVAAPLTVYYTQSRSFAQKPTAQEPTPKPTGTDSKATPEPEVELPATPIFEDLPPDGSGEAAANAEPSSSTSGRKGGFKDGLPKSAYESSTDRKRNAMAKYSGYAAMLAALGGTLYLGRALEPEERAAHPAISDGWDDFFSRINARARDFMDFYNEPPFDKLLPDPIPEYQRPYTLEWTREHGWRTAKRPGLDYFLAYLFNYYEIVVFTNQPDTTAAPIIQKVDAQPGYIMYPLFRAHTRYINGKYVKDLNFLNRDLKKVVMLETNPDAWSANPDNTIKLPPWTGDAKDKDLIAHIPFLEYIAALGVEDVRDVIRDYDGKHIPTEFARREALLKEELKKEVAAKGSQKKGPPEFVYKLVGMKKPEPEEPKTFMDKVRERGQMQYMETQRHLEQHKEEMLREQKAAEAEMASQMKTSLSKIFTEGLPKAPGQ